MEKRSIGKFIAILRKANGMTQKELGERLFVSDKTISRWEQDESTPELALIPVIAEIFGITTDELLHGERNPPEAREENQKYQEPLCMKTSRKKQFANMLHRHTVKFRIQSMISVGIALLGVIAAIICNVGFTRAVIGFCVGIIFILVGVICQICFTTSARIPIDEDEDENRIIACKAVNSFFVETTAAILMLDLALFGFLLPLAVFSISGYHGIDFGGWMLYGLLFALIAVILGYLIYVFWVRDILIKHELRYADDDDRKRIKINQKLLKKLLLIVIGVTLLLSIMVSLTDPILSNFVVKVNVFNNYEDFQEFMRLGAIETIYRSPSVAPDYANSIETAIMPSGEDQFLTESEENYYYHEESEHYFQISTITNSDGNVVIEYVDEPAFYSKLEFNYKSEDLLPIKVITESDRQIVYNVIARVKGLLIFLMVVDVIACTVVYIKKHH